MFGCFPAMPSAMHEATPKQCWPGNLLAQNIVHDLSFLWNKLTSYCIWIIAAKLSVCLLKDLRIRCNAEVVCLELIAMTRVTIIL